MTFTTGKRVQGMDACKVEDFNVLWDNCDDLYNTTSFCGAQAHGTTSIPNSGTNTVVTGYTVDFDTSLFYSGGSPTRFTINTPINYVQFCINYSWASSATAADITLCKNGTGTAFSGRPNVGWDLMGKGSISGPWLEVVNTDIFEVYASHTSGAAIILTINIGVRGLKT